MDKLFLFNPQMREYKTPFGAVRCGEKIRISSKMCRNWVWHAELLVFSERTGEDKCFPLIWDGKEKGIDVYTCEMLADDTPGVFWYCFRVHTLDGNVVFCGKNGIVNELQCVQRYQLTVCSKNYVTPSWFSEGVTYHIFVDRFFRDSKSEKLSCDDFFYVHSNSDEAPFFKPNEKGEVENRDIYGGNIKGITEKLSYLETLGVKTIYLSPVFEAWSNHKYNTADYKKLTRILVQKMTFHIFARKRKSVVCGLFSMAFSAIPALIAFTLIVRVDMAMMERSETLIQNIVSGLIFGKTENIPHGGGLILCRRSMSWPHRTGTI